MILLSLCANGHDAHSLAHGSHGRREMMCRPQRRDPMNAHHTQRDKRRAEQRTHRPRAQRHLRSQTAAREVRSARGVRLFTNTTSMVSGCASTAPAPSRWGRTHASWRAPREEMQPSTTITEKRARVHGALRSSAPVDVCPSQGTHTAARLLLRGALEAVGAALLDLLDLVLDGGGDVLLLGELAGHLGPTLRDRGGELLDLELGHGCKEGL